MSVLNDKLKVLGDVVRVISINIDIDIESLASPQASYSFKGPNIRHWLEGTPSYVCINLECTI